MKKGSKLIMKKFFEVPTQVRFWNSDIMSHIGGIAYRDEVICGCCGGVVSVDDILADAEHDGVTGIVELSWENIEAEISGDY